MSLPTTTSQPPARRGSLPGQLRWPIVSSLLDAELPFGRFLRDCDSEVANPDQVIRCRGEGKHPSDPMATSIFRLGHRSDCLHPAEDFLDPLAGSLTHLVAVLASGSTVDCARAIG